VALVCDNQLFVKPTPGGRALIENPVEAPPYRGAKPYFLVVDEIEDGEWLARLIRTTVQELPAPKPKLKRGSAIVAKPRAKKTASRKSDKSAGKRKAAVKKK
jgi:TfoX/Sxy family transcriptional regulator of competence genes